MNEFHTITETIPMIVPLEIVLKLVRKVMNYDEQSVDIRDRNFDSKKAFRLLIILIMMVITLFLFQRTLTLTENLVKLKITQVELKEELTTLKTKCKK